MKSGNARQWLVLVSLLSIFAGIWLEYAPSLDLVPLADHLVYLIETRDDHTTIDILKHTYSWPRTRIIARGDAGLYRPVLFAFLAWIKGTFNTQITQQQALGIFLHCVLVALTCGLFRQLWAMAAPALPNDMSTKRFQDNLAVAAPLVLTAFFALSFVNAGMVIWVHIYGYLLFMILVLASLNLLITYVADPPSRRWLRLSMIGAVWMSQLLAAFTFEMGQFVAILTGVYLLLVSRARHRLGLGVGLLAVFAAIPLGYQAANSFDQGLHAGQFEPESLVTVLGEGLTSGILPNAWRFFLYSLIQPLFPDQANFRYFGRLFIEEPALARLPFNAWTVFGVVALTTGAAITVRGARVLLTERNRIVLLTLGLFLCLVGVYFGIIVVARMNRRPVEYILSMNSYYAGKSLVFLLLVLCLTWAHARPVGSRPWQITWILFLASLALLSVRSAVLVYDVCGEFRHVLAPHREPIDLVNDFVDKHRSEADFSIAFDHAHSTPVVKDEGGLSILSIFFREHENNYRPRYVLTLRDDVLLVRSGSEYRAPGSDEGDPIFPEAVKIGARYNIFRLGKSYFSAIQIFPTYYTTPKATVAESEEDARNAITQMLCGMPLPPSFQPGKKITGGP